MRHPLHALQDLALASLSMADQLADAFEQFFKEHPALAELARQALERVSRRKQEGPPSA